MKNPAHDLLLDLAAYCQAALSRGDSPAKVLASVVRDLVGYRDNRHEGWWWPRVKGYAERPTKK